MKDFGYDVSDYRDVDPMFGTLADFDALLAEAHARGLKVIIDQVWSHTSDRIPGSSRAPPRGITPKADWYVWADAKPDGTPPNNWLASFGGPSWTWSAKRRQYYLHNFLPEQPDLNFWNPRCRTRSWTSPGSGSTAASTASASTSSTTTSTTANCATIRRPDRNRRR
jgi:alpha-glucosidase